MTYEDFYDIAEYGNANWKGCFTPREIAVMLITTLLILNNQRQEVVIIFLQPFRNYLGCWMKTDHKKPIILQHKLERSWGYECK